MKTNKLLLTLVTLLLFITTGFRQDQKSNFADGKRWSGTVKWMRKTQGGHTVFFEWRMEATIEDGVCAVVHSYQSESDEGVTAKCRNEGQAELELGIDKETKEYSIWVDVPGCYGTKIDHGVQSDFGATDETAIVINKQPLPQQDPLISLSGRLITRDTNPGDNSVTTETYDWTLEKDKKKKVP